MLITDHEWDYMKNRRNLTFVPPAGVLDFYVFNDYITVIRIGEESPTLVSPDLKKDGELVWERNC